MLLGMLGTKIAGVLRDSHIVSLSLLGQTILTTNQGSAFLKSEVKYMLGYKLYLLDKAKGCKLIAVLPERRKKAKRITEESVKKWGTTLLGDRINRKDIFFERVTINDIRERILWVNPSADCH